MSVNSKRFSKSHLNITNMILIKINIRIMILLILKNEQEIFLNHYKSRQNKWKKEEEQRIV